MALLKKFSLSLGDIDTDISYLFGYLIGDGWISKSGEHVCWKVGLENSGHIYDLLEKRINLGAKTYDRGSSIVICISSVSFNKWLINNGFHRKAMT